MRDLHPSLWLATTATGFVHLSIGLAFIFVAIPSSTTFLGPALEVLPFRVWGVLSIALSICGISGLAFGLNLVTHQRLIRVYHGLGVFMATAWAISEAIALLGGNLGLVAAPALWAWLGASHAIMLGEPPINPAARRR